MEMSNGGIVVELTLDSATGKVHVTSTRLTTFPHYPGMYPCGPALTKGPNPKVRVILSRSQIPTILGMNRLFPGKVIYFWVLRVMRFFMKPGGGGTPHDKNMHQKMNYFTQRNLLGPHIAPAVPAAVLDAIIRAQLDGVLPDVWEAAVNAELASQLLPYQELLMHTPAREPAAEDDAEQQQRTQKRKRDAADQDAGVPGAKRAAGIEQPVVMETIPRVLVYEANGTTDLQYDTVQVPNTDPSFVYVQAAPPRPIAQDRIRR